MKKYILLVLIITFFLTGCFSKKYKVTFMDDNSEIKTVLVEPGEVVEVINEPKKEGYIFVTWLKDDKEYNFNDKVTGNITLKASWTKVPDTPNNHTVTFNFGNYLKTQTVEDGKPVVKPQNDPEKDKHTFLGWYVGDSLYNFDDPVTKDIIIAAKFKRDQIVVNYDLNGGTGTVQVEIDKGSIPDKPKNPTKFGYNFIGWLLDGKPYNFDFPLNDDTTIKANWEAIVYVQVTFDTDGGNQIKSEMLASGSILTKLPTPEKVGFTFKYWSFQGNKFDVNTKIDTDITLVAVYEEITDN